jgi:hypothetical protein
MAYNLITYCNKCHKIVELSRKMRFITNPLYKLIQGRLVMIYGLTHERLKNHTVFGDSFDDILNRLMNIVGGKSKK